MIAHPITQRMPPLDFEISCSLDPGTAREKHRHVGDGVVESARGLLRRQLLPSGRGPDRCPLRGLDSTWAMRHGQGRIVAYTDSTQFSNFSTFEPGKPEVMMGMVEWLNHRGGETWLNELFTAAAIILAVVAVGLGVGSTALVGADRGRRSGLGDQRVLCARTHCRTPLRRRPGG